MDCNWSFGQFGEVICSPYPWGLHDEVEFKYYDGGSKWVKVSNDAELATMFAKHKEKENFHVRLQNDVVVPALHPNGSSRSSRQNSSSVSARRRGGLTSVGNGRRVPIEVEPDSYNYGDDEERLYSNVVQNLQWTSRAENQDEADNDVHLVDDEVGEEEDLAAVEWDRENPRMEEGSIFASMSECRNALVTYCIKAERTFEVDKSDQVKVNPFKHTCEESTLRKETISRAKSRWVAEEVKWWVTENHQVGAKELQKNIKDKFKIQLPYMRVFNGKQQVMDSIYGPAGNIQQYVHDYYSVARFKATYAHALPALEGKQQWDKVDPGFKLCAPILKRAAGRLRKSRIRPRSEGAGLGARRCGGSGHFSKCCDNAVDPAFGESFDENVDTNEDPNEEENVDPNEEENYDHNEKAPNYDHNEEAPNDDHNEEASNDDPNDDHNEEAPNDDPSEAPNDGGQTSVVASSSSSVVVSKNKVKVPTTKRRREEAISTSITRSKVDATSTRITRSKVDATSTRITRSKVDARSTRIKMKP
ncbi:hypothetical protein ACQ4PT_015411 [Festuca glaucescens]